MRFVSSCILLIILCGQAAFSFSGDPDLIDKLKAEINKKSTYDQQKETAIKQLKNQLHQTPAANAEQQFNFCNRIYEEYRSYQYDSAYVYADKMQALSQQMDNKVRTDYAKLKVTFILLSSGLFKEAFDNLEGIDVRRMPDSVKLEYYTLLTRANYDIAAFNNDRHYSPNYVVLANKYIDSAIAISSAGSFDRIYFTGYKAYKNKQYEVAEIEFNNLLKRKLDRHQYAIVTSTLSKLYMDSNPQKGTDLLIEAAIGDIQSSTKETVALLWLAELLYKNGDTKNAYDFLQQAMADAEFYGARQRQFQISAVLPIVAAQQLTYSEKERTRFLTYLVLITVLALGVIAITIQLFKQLKMVQAKEKIIEDKNTELEAINGKLQEDTRIKEDYIGYFFNVISGYISKLEKLKHSIDTKLSIKKYDDIQVTINNINIKKERETLFYTFDHVFLKIFPNFITAFNSLFAEKDQIWPKEHEVLTTDLRIFALMRLGITDVEAVANILEYSEKTIYVYKMRIKAKALVHGEEFDARVMAIKAVDTPQAV
ncbi:tetratricopeptide repeat protein [Mucilaginibacter sp. Bleaf8]|uniref:DUF6377 domain-containing protein n=1 Tax=Mucilaginibacter sp. Bleaf8 TaxID=2834430 RepID=UPI001BCBD298|nr:DUF6377 domain-containing protein [Mucilaginibacter sp. Bleaf8]MBS7563746.1 tetratricopeptide repeat protein [Mucilaginibacter sp. Bleaf8]